MKLIIFIIFILSFPLQAVTSSTSSKAETNENKTLFRDSPYALHVKNGYKWYLEKSSDKKQAKYIGEIENNIPHGFGEIFLNDEIIFSGNFLNGLENGIGTSYPLDGIVYKGEFKDGLRSGQGKYINTNSGMSYEGEWLNDLFHGFGIYNFGDGTIYEGEFKSAKRNGQGKMSWPNGTIYDGEWLNDKKDGEGKQEYPEGHKLHKYEGGWKNNRLNGQGVLFFSNGAKYEGGWKNDRYNGFGTMIEPDGRKYKGNWKNDKKDGQGVYIWPDGQTYIGEWQNDEREGYSIEIYSDGSMLWGERKENTLQKGLKVNSFNKIIKVADNGVSVTSELEKDIIISDTINKLNELALFDQIFVHDPSLKKKIYLIAIESMNSNRKKLMTGLMSAGFITNTPVNLLKLISNFEFEEASILLEAINANKKPTMRIKKIEHNISDIFAYNFDINDPEQTQLNIKELGEEIEIEIINKPSWLLLSIDKSQANYIAKLTATEDIEAGEFSLDYIITDNLLGYKEYKNKKITINPAVNTYKGYGFLLESSEADSPSECFDAITKGALINLADSESDSYLNLNVKNEYYYYRGDLYSFRLGSLSWKKNKKYFICEKIHINQKDFIEYTTRDVEIPSN